MLTDKPPLEPAFPIIYLNSILYCKYVYIFIEGIVETIAIIDRLGLGIVYFVNSLRVEIISNIRCSVILLATGPAIISAIFIFVILAVLGIAIVLIISIFGSSAASSRRPGSLCTR